VSVTKTTSEGPDKGSSRARLRTALYMATLSAAQHNPAIKAFYRRLRDAGKPPKVARCAAARTLLHLVWVVGTKHQPFDPEYQQQQHEALPELAA
jgi:transposase